MIVAYDRRLGILQQNPMTKKQSQLKRQTAKAEKYQQESPRATRGTGAIKAVIRK